MPFDFAKNNLSCPCENRVQFNRFAESQDTLTTTEATFGVMLGSISKTFAQGSNINALIVLSVSIKNKEDA